MTLVGVRAYSESKDGVDVGTLLDIGEIGVKASTDVEALLKIDCDAIIYAALDIGVIDTTHHWTPDLRHV